MSTRAVSLPGLVSAPVIKHPGQQELGEEGGYLDYNSRLQSIVEGSQAGTSSVTSQ